MEQMRACMGTFGAAYETARSDLIDVPTSPIRLDGIILPLILNRVNIIYWHDLYGKHQILARPFSRLRYWHDLFQGSDTRTTSAGKHNLFFRRPLGCHLADMSLFSLSLFILFLSLHSLSLFISCGPPSSLIILSLSLFSRPINAITEFPPARTVSPRMEGLIPKTAPRDTRSDMSSSVMR